MTNKKLAVVISGWHYPYSFYQQIKNQQIPKNWNIDVFVVSHRDPELEIVYEEKQPLMQQFGTGILQDIDKQLYGRIITKKEIKDFGFTYNEEPNDVGDLNLFNQWVQRHYKSQYDYIMYTHDDTFMLNDRLFLDILEKKAPLITNPSPSVMNSVNPDYDWHHLASGVHQGTTCPRTSFTVVSRELLDKLAPVFKTITTEGTDLNRTDEVNTPYEISGNKINTSILGTWNAPGRNFWKWCHENGYENKSVRLSDTYRVTPYFIEGERGFIWSPDSEQSLTNYLSSKNIPIEFKTSSLKKLVIFGPWCGEFCYELSWWIPEIRKLRNENFKDYDAFMVGYNGRKILYDDFIDNYIPYTQELEDTLLYPATCGQHDVEKYQDIIPENLLEYVNEVGQPYLDKYEDISLYVPGNIPFGSERTLSEQPFGEYKHYNASYEIMCSVKEEIKFDNDRETVALMARIRNRVGKTCYLDWNPEHWKTFINYLINDLKVNVVMIGIEQKEGSSAGASLTFENSENLKGIIFKGKDSVERQIALLQLTKCSIYGASGTACFPFFIKGAATFTQQTDTEGFRLKFQWERDLTNNLEKVEIFDKYKNNEIYDSPPEELYEVFKKFYQKLI